MKKQIVTVKSLVAATALLASGISLAAAAELYPSAISGDQVIVRTPSGAAAYAETTAPVIRHHHKNKS